MFRFCTSRVPGIGVVLAASLFASGCSFLPGFGFFEQPTLYFLPVSQVANAVACELQEFLVEHRDDAGYKDHKWLLADEDVGVKLSLQTDDNGSVNFTGIDAARLGFVSLQNLIATQAQGKNSVPSLGAKVSAKRAKSVQINFSVSPTALKQDKVKDPSQETEITRNCLRWRETENPLEKLYLKDWLNNYFETINIESRRKEGHEPQPYNPGGPTTELLRSLRNAGPPPVVPRQFKIQSLQLSTSIMVAADLSAGATPNVLGNGSVFIFPINGLSLGYNADYSHKIDITLNVCEASTSCRPKDALPKSALLVRQCHIYSLLSPLLNGVKPPRDVEIVGKGGQLIHQSCDKDGFYKDLAKKIAPVAVLR